MNDFSGLPSVDRLLKTPDMEALIKQWGRLSITQALRSLQTEIRRGKSVPDWALDPLEYPKQVNSGFAQALGSNLRPVYNLAGTIIHTNLGRSLLSEEMANAGLLAATQAVTLEFDLENGRRGDRDGLIEHMLCTLTGAEAATVVNNNAAAVLLVLNSLAENSDVPVSRGELVEIGGSFRIPEIMQKAGCCLKEVGTTNRTHSNDYESAINESTALLLKVHPSNYHIKGFTKEVTVKQLSEVAQEHDLPLYVDLGSGALTDLEKLGLPKEPTAAEVLNQGADVISFSGDKLLGSIQAGIILGKKSLIERIKRNPLKRALRVDKITLGILTETLRYYQDPNTVAEKIPLLATLTRPLTEIKQNCDQFKNAIAEILPDIYHCSVRESACQIGSGSMPDQDLSSWAVCVSAESASNLIILHARLRRLPKPVISRIQEDLLWMDLRTVNETEKLITNIRHLDVALAE